MKPLLIRLKQLVKSKRLNVFILFLAMAFFILMITKLSRNYTNTVSFNIETVNVPAEVILLNKNKTLDVSFKTDGFKWLTYVINTPKLIVDFKHDSLVKGKDYVFNINNNKKKLQAYLPKSAENITFNTNQLNFKFDSNYTKNIPVKLNKNIVLANGFDFVEDINISPKTVKLIGPKSVLDTLSVVNTKLLELENLNASQTINLELDLSDFKENIITETTTVKVGLQVDKFTEGNFTIPIELINAPKDVKVTHFPKNATIVYYSQLATFNRILKSDFRVVVDYKSRNTATNYLVPELISKNKTIKTARVSLKKVDYIVTE